jgi:hypothetical protein
MKLRNGKTFKDDEPEDEYDWGYGINPETGKCECLDCTRIVGCVFHASQDERKKKAETKARTQVLYEATTHAIEKTMTLEKNQAPDSGYEFIDLYLLCYRAYYSRNYERTYREVYEKIGKTYWNRLMRKKPEDRGFICELCENGRIW